MLAFLVALPGHSILRDRSQAKQAGGKETKACASCGVGGESFRQAIEDEVIHGSTSRADKRTWCRARCAWPAVCSAPDRASGRQPSIPWSQRREKSNTAPDRSPLTCSAPSGGGCTAIAAAIDRRRCQGGDRLPVN